MAASSPLHTDNYYPDAITSYPDTIRALFRGYPKDPKLLAETYKALEIQVGHVEQLVHDIDVMFQRDERATRRVYILPEHRKEFVTFYRERFKPAYNELLHLKRQIENLLSSPVTHSTKTKVSNDYLELSKRIDTIIITNPEFLLHFNKIKFIPADFSFKSLITIPINMLTSKTHSRIKTYAIFAFGFYSIYNYYFNGLFRTGLHAAAFSGAYIILGQLGKLIKEYD